MKGVKELKARLGSVGNIKKVTSTMELVATARMKKLQERALASRPYAEAIKKMMGRVAQFAPTEVSPLLEVPEKVTRECLIVVAADKGLCGAFNTNVFRKATEHLRKAESEGIEVDVYSFGLRTEKFFTRIGARFTGKLDEKLETVGYRRVAVAMDSICDDYIAGKYQRVSLIFTRMKSAVSFVPSDEVLVPLSPEVIDDAKESAEEKRFLLDYKMEPSPEEILERLIPKTLEIKLLNAVYESLAAEFASRRIAMKNATDSATDMIDEIRMEYNKARQAAITGEILEITGGAEALKG